MTRDGGVTPAASPNYRLRLRFGTTPSLLGTA